MTAPAAGWFPDPAGRPGTYRWWDGAAWTRVLTDDPSAPSPAVEAEPGTEAADRSAGQNGDQALAADGSAGPEGAPIVPPERGSRRVYPPGYEPAIRRARRSARARSVLGMVAAVVIAAVVVLVLINNRSSSAELLDPPPPEPSSAAPSAAPPTSATDLTYDALTRAVGLTGMKLTMPDRPYTVERSSTPVIVLQDGVQAVATVQAHYQGTSNWVAVVGVGHVPAAAAGKDLSSTADALLDRFVKVSFSGRTRVEKATRKTYTDYPRPVRIINADVHYKIKGVKSSYDRVSMLVTKGADDGYIAWISSRPNKADATLRKALQNCIGSIQITT